MKVYFSLIVKQFQKNLNKSRSSPPPVLMSNEKKLVVSYVMVVTLCRTRIHDTCFLSILSYIQDICILFINVLSTFDPSGMIFTRCLMADQLHLGKRNTDFNNQIHS